MTSRDQISKDEQGEKEKGGVKLTSIEIQVLEKIIEELKAIQFLQLSEGAKDQYTIIGKVGTARETTRTKEENDFLNEYKTFQNIVFVYANLYEKFSEDTFSNANVSEYSSFERNMKSIIDSPQTRQVLRPEIPESIENSWKEIRTVLTSNTGSYTREELEEKVRTLNTTNKQILHNFFLLIKVIIQYKYRESEFVIDQLHEEDLNKYDKGSTSRLSKEFAHIPNLLIRPDTKKNGLTRELFITQNVPKEISDELVRLARDYSDFNVLILNIKTAMTYDLIEGYTRSLNIPTTTTMQYYILWSVPWLKMEIPTAHRMFQDAIDCTISWIDNYRLISKLQEGNRLINSKNYEAAAKYYEQWVQSDTTYVYLGLVGIAITLYRREKYTEALSYCDKALEVQPYYRDAWINKGLVNYKMGRYNEAIEYYNRSLKIYPSDAYVYESKAITFLASGNYKDAEENVNEALSEDFESANAWNIKGNILLQEGRFEDAIPNYDKAIELDPRFANALNNKGKAVLNLTKYQEADKLFDMALDIDKSNKNALNNKGTVQRDGYKDHNRAIHWYDRALEISSTFTAALFNKAKVLYIMANYGEALQLVEKALNVKIKSQADERLYVAAVKLRDDINEKLRPGGEKQIVTATDLKLTYSSWRDAEKDSKFPDKKMYQFHVIIDVPNTILNQIEFVTYRLPDSWKDLKVQKITDRSTNFKLKELAWASFTLHADVKIRGQDDLVTLSQEITLQEESPRLPV